MQRGGRAPADCGAPANRWCRSPPRAESRRERDETAARPVDTDGVEQAREALRALESEPVIKIKAAPSDEAGGDDEPVLKVSPGEDSAEPPSPPEPPAPP